MLRQLAVALWVPTAAALCSPAPAVCVVQPAPNGTDSAPAIAEAFRRCGHNPEANRGQILFGNETYHIKSVMNTTGLSNVDIDLKGTLLWDTNIDYWLNNSLAVGYQNQSSAWLFGGDSVNWVGHGYGTLDGNGQVWYDFINGTNNCGSSPMQLRDRDS
jgi:galacturan 1,4-alpha-galacturonidase